MELVLGPVVASWISFQYRNYVGFYFQDENFGLVMEIGTSSL